MQITRRLLLESASAGVLLAALPREAVAYKWGSVAAAITNNARVSLNIQQGYANLAKGFGLQADPSNQNSTGYPAASPNPNLGAATSMPANYFGEFVWKWSGVGSMFINGGLPYIVSQSSANSGTVFPVGDNAGGNTILTNVDTPRIQFLFGFLIQALTDSGVSNGSGGTMIRVTTKSLVAFNTPSGTPINISGIASQTNANGTWTTTPVDNTHFDLVGSTYSSGQGPGGVAGTGVFQATNMSINMGNFSSPGSGSWSMSNLVWCKVGNETAVTNGAITDPVQLAQFQFLLNPNSLSNPNVAVRLMDFTGVQSSWEADFSQRVLPTQMCLNAAGFRTGYWVGAVTNGGSDNYTCADPATSGGIAVWNGTNYVDNGILQGKINTTNSGGNPTLAVGAGPAKPIYVFGQGYALNFFATGPAASAGIVLQFTVNATYINGGSPRVVSYTTVTADTVSASNLSNNVATAFQNDATMSAAGLQYGNPFITIYPRTAQAGRLTISQTSGPALVTFETASPSSVASGNGTFMYNYLLDAFIFRPGGMVLSGPFEQATEIANACNANVWWNWGSTKGAFITATTNFFATNLNSQLRFDTEPWNELWNTGAAPWFFCNSLGSTLGFPAGGIVGSFGYAAVRICQYYALSSAAWAAAGRTALKHQLLQPNQTGEGKGGNFDFAQLQGAYLNRSGSTVNTIPTNAIYGTYGGLNGSGGSTAPVSTNYNIFPNRPVDLTRAGGCAPYWSSHWLGNGGSFAQAGSPFEGIWGTVAQNTPWLQAALNYCTGSPATAFASMANQFTGVTSGGSGNNGFNFADMQTTFAQEEAIFAQYDGARPSGVPNLIVMDYECGPSWGVGANAINGINSVNSGDISAMAAQFAVLGWTTAQLAAFTVSGTGNLTEMATMCVEMFQGWKLDTDINGNALNTGSYKNMIKTSYYAARNGANTNREAHAAQFGYGGPNQWCLFPGDYNGTKYASYTAIHEFNS